MTKREWVLMQFNRFEKANSKYRNAILMSSFIEMCIRDSNIGKDGKRPNFFESLIHLGMKIDPFNKQKLILDKFASDPDCLKNIEAVRLFRNELLHEVLNETMPHEYIERLVEETIKKLKFIYQKSELIRKYFREKYNLDPKYELK